MKIHLWQGEEDRNVPPTMGRYQASVIPDCDARFFPGEGHMLMLNHLDEMMTLATSSASASAEQS